jgi:hypothetical protein
MTDDTKNKLLMIQQMVESIESNLDIVRHALTEIAGGELPESHSNGYSKRPINGVSVSNKGKVIEGVFDGESMLGPDGRKYPVPPNYASKSKLVSGDILKLTIADNGSFIYKQIGPVERVQMVGTLKRIGGDYFVHMENGEFRVLTASVTYFKAEPGDQVTVIVAAGTSSGWGAIENIIPRVIHIENLDEITGESPHGAQADEVEDFKVPKTLFKRSK